MSFLKKIISVLKTKDEGLYAMQAPFDEDGDPVDKRRKDDERTDLHNEFCIFLSSHNNPLDMEKAPFLLANLTNISSHGAAFSCFSKTACTPYMPEVEDEIKVSSHLWLVPNLKLDLRTCGSASCSAEHSKDASEMEAGVPMKAEALWVKPEQFGCVFKEDKDKIIKMIESLQKNQL